MAAPASSRKPSSRTHEKERHAYERIGPFEIKDEIGRGSFATVYKGYRVSTSPPSPVAIKAVTRNKLTPKLLDNLESEIRLLKGINHRNVVELVDCLKTDTHIYLVMAFSSAGDLSQYIRKRGLVEGLSIKDRTTGYRRPIFDNFPHPKEGGLNEVVVRSFLGQLSDALEFLRSQNIIHRDIKPQNLLLSPYPTSTTLVPECNPSPSHIPGVPILKVADFGFARFLPQASMAETLCGSPLYMAPEILRYEKYDAKADLWSAGAVLYEMCTGRPPFHAGNHVELLRKIEKTKDRVLFPDEKQRERSAISGGDSAEENAGSNLDKEKPQSSREPVTQVASDLKAIIKRLLKRNPLERSAFSDFFSEAALVSTGGLAAAYMPATSSSGRLSNADAPPASPVEPICHDKSVTAPSNPPARPPAEHIKTPITDPYSIKTSGKQNVPRQDIIADADRAQSRLTARSPPPSTKTAAPQVPVLQPVQTKRRRSSFAPKYIVGSLTNVSPIETEGEALPQVAAPTAGPASLGSGTPTNSGLKTRDYALRTDLVPSVRNSKDLSLGLKSSNLDSSIAEGDSFLAREYVVVDKAPVQVNALADELASQRPNTLSRIPSKGFLTKPLSALSQMPMPMPLSSSPSPPAVSPYPPPSPYSNAAVPFPPPSYKYTGSASPRSRPALSSYNSAPQARAFSYTASPLALASVAMSNPTQTIAKAFNMASLKIFGNPKDGLLIRRPSSGRKAIPRFNSGPSDSAEIRVVTELEEVAQKALVIFDFADSKMHLAITAINSTTGPNEDGAQVEAKITVDADDPFDVSPTDQSHGSVTASSTGAAPHLMLAAEALVLYLRSLSFLQAAIQKAKAFWEQRRASLQDAGTDFNEAVQWLRTKFNECYEKAEFARSRLGEGDLPEITIFGEKLIYERALEMARAAAVNELKGDQPRECEVAYETALYLLYGLTDESIPDIESVKQDNAREIESFVTSIRARLAALRKKMIK